MVFLFLALGACGDRPASTVEEVGETILEPEMPVLPPMPPVRVGPDRYVNVDDRVAFLIDNPNDDFARQMRKAINDGVVLTRYGDLKGAGASFLAAPKVGDLAPHERPRSDGYYAVILIDPRLIAYLRDEPEAILKESIIFRHEFRHALQYLSAADEMERASFRRGIEEVATPEDCQYMYRHEYDAYWEGCEIAASWGLGSFPSGMCDVMEPVAFARRFYLHHTNDPSWWKVNGECASVWKGLTQ